MKSQFVWLGLVAIAIGSAISGFTVASDARVRHLVKDAVVAVWMPLTSDEEAESPG